MSSPLQQYKKLVLQRLGLRDDSVFGEDLVKRLRELGYAVKVQKRQSYADTTMLTKGDSRDIRDWTRYFCRLSDVEIDTIGQSALKGILLGLSVKASALPPEVTNYLLAQPAYCGKWNPESFVVPHTECFISVLK